MLNNLLTVNTFFHYSILSYGKTVTWLSWYLYTANFLTPDKWNHFLGGVMIITRITSRISKFITASFIFSILIVSGTNQWFLISFFFLLKKRKSKNYFAKYILFIPLPHIFRVLVFLAKINYSFKVCFVLTIVRIIDNYVNRCLVTFLISLCYLRRTPC